MDINAIFVALIGGGVVGFVEFLIRRHDAKKDHYKVILDKVEEVNQKLDSLEQNVDLKLRILEQKVDEVDEKGDNRNAITSRVRILRFMDELLEGHRFSKDRFDQVMTDIDEYERYCHDHPRFKNNQTASTIQTINMAYKERLAKHDFL